MSLVRPATLADVPGLAAAHVAIWRETYTGLIADEVLAGRTPERSADMWRGVLSAPPDDAPTRRRIVVADVGGEVVGFAWAGPALEPPGPADVQLYAINLLKAHHGSGLGQRLLDTVIGDGPAFLWMAERNPRAEAFYRRNGFELDGVDQYDEALGIREVRMLRPGRPGGGGLGVAAGPAYP